MAGNNAKCSICGKEYNVCVSCADTKTYTPWRTIVDTQEHYKIFIIIRDFTNKYIDKEEAKKLLSNCDLNDLDTFVVEIKDVINEIMKETVIEKVDYVVEPKKFVSKKVK